MTRFTGLRLFFGLMLGAFLWGGCASEHQTAGLQRAVPDAPVDLTKWHADTHPELRIGLDPLNNWRRLPDPTTSYQGGY